MEASNPLERAEQRLKDNLLENITLLKMLHAYGEKIESKLVERGKDWAVLLCLPTLYSSYDRQVYPDTESIVFVAGSNSDDISKLLKEFEKQKPLIFKVQNETYKNCIEEVFPIRPLRSFYTYSCSEPILEAAVSEVIEEDRINPRLMPLWSNNGYAHSELNDMFHHGARSYTLYEAGEPTSTCVTFCNYNTVWEIGAVYTCEEHRGKGHAKKVVSAAVNRLLEQKLLPRYQVLDTNQPSIKVADSVGLTRVVTLEHLYYEGS